jgi:hypothetical protein
MIGGLRAQGEEIANFGLRMSHLKKRREPAI